MDNIINRLRQNIWANYYVLFTRMLIGIAFIPSGLVKLFGERFTQISTDVQLGYFFDALYKSGMYWNFLGFSQVFAAFLLITQRFSRIGALIFMPIITNIAVITLSMDFNYTPVITVLMWLANLSLLLWEWPKLKTLFSTESVEKIVQTPELLSKNWTWFGLAFFIFLVLVLGIGKLMPEAKWVIYTGGILLLGLLFYALKLLAVDYKKSRTHTVLKNS